MVEELLEAAKTGDLIQIRYLVREIGLPVDSQHPSDGPTPLYWAACNGFVSVCSWLIDHRADPNFALPKSGSTPLHAAADRGHYDCVLLLICSGAKINQRTTSNWDTCLHLAAYRGFSSICSLLIDHGADVFLQNRQSRTPLDEAYITGKVDIVQMICKKHSELIASFKSIGKSSSSKRREGKLHSVSSAYKHLTEPHKTEDPGKGVPLSFPVHSSHQSIDFEDRIGIHQFDKGRRGSSFKDEAISSISSSLESLPSSSSSSLFSGHAKVAPEKQEISKIFSNFHSSLMEQLEMMSEALEEKDRDLLLLRKENELLKEELKKVAQGHKHC